MESLSKPSINPAKLLSSHSYQYPDKLIVGELFFEVPLDHSKPDGRRIRLFCRTAEKYENPVNPADAEKPKHLPLITYINGGPGFGCPHPGKAPWTKILLDKGYKHVTLDQRGMGSSNTVTAATLQREGDDQAQADYLTYFRQTSTVCDLEAIRLCMTKDYPENQRKWSIMGQSYGGWVSTSYLSMYPEGLRESFIFGGLPPVLETNPDKTVKNAIIKLKERSNAYYSKFPDDISRVATIISYLKTTSVKFPDGGVLTPGRFLEIGMSIGMGGGMTEVHDRVIRAVNDLDLFGEFTRPTLDLLFGWMSFDTTVLYALLHMPIYCQGEASNWAFDRMIDAEPDFDYNQDQEKYHWRGEMVFKRAFDDHSELRLLKNVAELLAKKEDWAPLYDIEQLKRNKVPVYAAVYTEDMYVGLETSLQTAGIIRGCKYFLTNQMYHDAIRGDTKEVLEALFKLRDDTLD